ncbi:MAG: cytochrome-c peroxidase [Crocinitomicaceae bacterium]|nr:cytochrome-c peroxidase [Flavobacteriales bacterium]NQZ37972.1 cytochrome-c peroxidase [Crocinitomicaceae bacterium]
MNKFILGVFTLTLGVFIYSCKKDVKGTMVQYNNAPYQLQFINYTLPTPTLPADNPLTVEKVMLGRMLFYNKNLSSDGTVSCASCHNQKNAFSDINKFSIGVDGATGDRQAMAIFNMAWHENEFFWDGRAHLLRDQSLGPIENPLEMNESLDNVIKKLYTDQEMKNQFIRAFGSIEITAEKMSLAMENFMMSIISEDSKYDRYLAGLIQLSPSEERGRILFFGEYNEFFPDVSGADCAHCHAGNNFENDLYMNNGLDENAQFVDFGRELTTDLIADRAKFKVTSLRNIAVTPPYMHDGRFETLEEVVDHYNSNVKYSSTVNLALLGTTSTGLMLDEEEKNDLVNFLKSLTDYTLLNNTAYSDPY